MNRADAIKLCRYVHAACPGQRLDEYTPQAWADILDGLNFSFDEARQAVISVKRRQPFVDCSEIIAECKRLRAATLEIEQREQIIEPVRRRQLHDARPARESIRSILSRHGRPELVAAMPAVEGDKPRHVQMAELEQMGVTP